MEPLLYFVSGHGFGHAVRSAQVIRELHERGQRCVIVSSAPRWIFDINLKGCVYEYREMGVDEGVAQIDSIRNDLPATLKRWERFCANSEEWIARGMRLIEETGARGIIADVGPLAFPLARRAGLPSVLAATFTWDWILDHYRADDGRFGPLAEKIHQWYLLADCMIHTPFSYHLPPVTPAHRVPLIAKKARAPKAAIRRRLGFENAPHYFISFGGCGVDGVERMDLRSMPDARFVFLGRKRGVDGNIINITEDDAAHEEVAAACDAVIGKPGYGTVAECVLNRTPMIYTSRGKFAEYEPMVEEMLTYIPARFIAQKALFSGGLGDILNEPLRFNDGHRSDSGTGAEEAAAIILERMDR